MMTTVLLLSTSGALKLLQNVETLDWVALYSGEICLDEVQRVRRVARRDIITLPTFLADADEYRERLRQIALINGLKPSCLSSCGINVELTIPAPARSRHPLTTVAPDPCQATKRVRVALPAPLPTAPAQGTAKGEKVMRGKDKLRITGSTVQIASSFRLLNNAAKRLSKLHKQWERSVQSDQTFERPRKF